MATAATASPAASSALLTTPQVAKRLGINLDKVLAWVHSGELRAINLVAKRRGAKRPRYRVTEADLAAFLASRAVVPTSPATRGRSRRRTDSAVTEYF